MFASPLVLWSRLISSCERLHASVLTLVASTTSSSGSISSFCPRAAKARDRQQFAGERQRGRDTPVHTMFSPVIDNACTSPAEGRTVVYVSHFLSLFKGRPSEELILSLASHAAKGRSRRVVRRVGLLLSLFERREVREAAGRVSERGLRPRVSWRAMVSGLAGIFRPSSVQL